MSISWKDDPEWRAFASDTGLPVPTRGEKLAVEAYKRTLKAEIQNSTIWYDADYTVEGLRAAVLAMLEEQ